MTIATTAQEEHVCPCRLPPPGRLRALRREARISLTAAAEQVGVDAMTLSRWERGLHQPRVRYVRALLDLEDWLRDRADQHLSRK